MDQNIRKIKELLYLPLSDEKEISWELTKNNSTITLILIRNEDKTYDLIHQVNTTIEKTLYFSSTYIVCFKKINSLVSSLKNNGFLLSKSPEAYQK